jgi:hypothetical protein
MFIRGWLYLECFWWIQKDKRKVCVNGTGRRWDGVLISTSTTFRQLDFNQPLIPRKPVHRNYIYLYIYIYICIYMYIYIYMDMWPVLRNSPPKNLVEKRVIGREGGQKWKNEWSDVRVDKSLLWNMSWGWTSHSWGWTSHSLGPCYPWHTTGTVCLCKKKTFRNWVIPSKKIREVIHQKSHKTTTPLLALLVCWPLTIPWHMIVLRDHACTPVEKIWILCLI